MWEGKIKATLNIQRHFISRLIMKTRRCQNVSVDSTDYTIWLIRLTYMFALQSEQDVPVSVKGWNYSEFSGEKCWRRAAQSVTISRKCVRSNPCRMDGHTDSSDSISYCHQMVCIFYCNTSPKHPVDADPKSLHSLNTAAGYILCSSSNVCISFIRSMSRSYCNSGAE